MAGKPEAQTNLAEEAHLTCPPLVPMFSFAARAWCLAFIDDLGPINWNLEIFDQLQVDAGLKEAIQGLVRGYSSHAKAFDDFLEGKGHGLVFLLHGPPGCGKTMTAESISEYLKKLLYYLSGGELGSSIDTIQYALERAFDLAARWDTILLIDEADAFLTKRDGVDIERNSLIAVFLRLLEYQSGIVFLTTNRFEDFDLAFESRIHLEIPLSALDSSQRKLVWGRLAQKNGCCTLSSAQLEALGQLPLDGRRIKNILRLASLFAANRTRAGESVAEEEDATPGGENAAVEVTMTFDNIKKVLPLTSSRIRGSHNRSNPKEEGLSRAFKDLMKQFGGLD